MDRNEESSLKIEWNELGIKDKRESCYYFVLIGLGLLLAGMCIHQYYKAESERFTNPKNHIEMNSPLVKKCNE